MEPLNKNEIIPDLSPDQIIPKTWNEAVTDKEKLSNHAEGISPNEPIQSPNFVSGVRGYRLDTNGNAEFNNGTFRGTFNIGGTSITINNTEDIQTNIDIIDAAGGGTLYLQNGTYTLTADVSVPGGVLLKGISRDGVIIDCNGTYKVQITGTNIYNTGTLAINDTQDEIVGTGTTFTSAMVGRYVFLSDAWYLITAFTDTTHMDISPAYSGANLSGYAVAISNTNFNGAIGTLTITGATAAGLALQYAMEPIMDDVVITDNGTGIDADYVVFPRYLVTATDNGVNLNQNFVEGFYWDFSEFSRSTTGAGIIMTNTNNATAFNFSCVGNTGNGISATNCDNIAFLSYDISNNGAIGIEFVAGCDDNQVGLGRIFGNTSDGVKLTATSDRNTIVATSIKDSGGYGINIAASTCDNNVINSPVFSNNSSGNINDSGTLTVIIADDTAYNATTWNGNLGVATKNAIRDKFESLTTFSVASGLTSKAINSTTDLTIAHGLSATPKLVRITCYCAPATNEVAQSVGTGTGVSAEQVQCLNTQNGTGVTTFQDASSILLIKDSGDVTQCQADLKTLDGTNIVLQFTTNANSGSTRLILWEAFA